MAELLQNWLNKEIELSKPVTNFEKEFANGYLFGELLYKFNQQPNFAEFSKKEDVAEKIKNFDLLRPTLATLKIKFDANIFDGIMRGERGSALRLLYQLKTALEKVYPPTDVQVLSKTGKIGDNRPAMKLTSTGKEKYEALSATLLHQKLQSLNKPQKQIIMERHLKKFDDELLRQDASAKAGDKAEADAREKRLQELRAAQINKVARNAGFMEEWLQKGVQDWQKNQSIKKDRERRELEFEYKETEKYHQLALRKIGEASKEVQDGISQFEKNLKTTYGIETKVSKHEAERAVSQSIAQGASPLRQTTKSQRFSTSLTSKAATLMNHPLAQSTMKGTSAAITHSPGVAMTLTSTGLRSKDKKVVSDTQKKERERRRRKMIVDQMKTATDMETERRQKEVLERMKWQAKQEEELVYEKWRTEQCKNVIIDNRKLREARYEKRREIDNQTAIWREEEMLKSMKEQMAREMETMKDRDREMRILGKQAHRERRNEFGAQLFDSIFEIANEAYIHQQMCDSADIDSRNWHEWLQLFIEEMPIEGTLSRLADTHDQESSVQKNASEQEESQAFITLNENDPHDKLDKMELVDYLKCQGQWPQELVAENPPNLEQFLTGQSDAAPQAAAAKGAKGAPAKAATESVTLEEGDADLPMEAPNNFQLGDAIEQVIALNYAAREAIKRPKMPQHLSLKLCFIGYAFSGKKTQAEMLKNQYGVQTYQLNDLVSEALVYSEQNPEPIAKTTEEEQQTNDEDDTISDDSELEQDYNAQEDFRQCGLKISELLSEGLEIPDEVYVQLYVAKLRLTYQHKTKRTLRKELTDKVKKQREILLKIEPLQKELQEMQEQTSEEGAGGRKKKHHKDPHVIQAKIEQLRKEITELERVESNGWVLIDFPSTFAQAKLLETALSGYLPKSEEAAIDRETQLKDAFLLVQPTAKDEPPKTLIKSGLDAVIWFDLSREECMRRALGRRQDTETGNTYHIEDVPPPIAEAPLCERLVPIDEDHNLESTLIDRWMSFDQGAKALENWLYQFGDSQRGQSILHKLNAHTSQEGMAVQIQEVVESVLEAKKQREAAIRERINSKLEAAEAQEALRLKQQEEEEAKKHEDEAHGQHHESEVPKKEEAKVERPEPATERVPPKDPSVKNIDQDFKPTILHVWQELSHNYKCQMQKVFRQVRVQRERVVSTFSHIQSKYLEFIHRPDTKQEKLEQFIKDFNDFSDQFPDLREDEATKDELHQRVDTLSDELWEIIEDRKEQHIEERKKIMESGWVELELTFLVNSASSLMQAEVDKFKSSIQILHDYYHAFEDKLIPEPPPMITQDLIADGEDLPPVESLAEGNDPNVAGSYSYPRLDKIFEKALKAQFVPDVTLSSAAAQDKAGKGGAPAKGAKDPKKPAEDEKPAEESQYVKEMRAAIKVEKSILRFRLAQIRNWTLKRLRDVRSKAIKVYTKLEDWIHVANKAENDAVDEMCVVLKRAIEEEKKIQDELRIKFMDFCVDEKIMNFIEPPPEKLPAMEQVRHDRFSIRQLRTLVKELEELARQFGDGNGGVPNKILQDLFIRKLENSKTLQDDGSLPEEWWGLREYDFQNMIRNLDRQAQGIVSWRQLATFLILLRSPIPSDKDLESLKKAFQQLSGANFLLDKTQFQQIKTWFDESEHSIDRDYSITFPRVAYIKELLFRVNREHALPPAQASQERIALGGLQQVLQSARLIISANTVKKSDQSAAQAAKTFGDVLFMQSNLPQPTTNSPSKRKGR